MPAPFSALPLLAAVAGIAFSHHDWDLACDNTGTCRAAGYHADDDALAVSLLLERPAGPGAAVTGRVVVGHYADDPFPPGRSAALTLFVDDRAHGRIALDDARGTLTPEQVDAVLPAVVGTGRVSFGDDGGRRWRLSPRGATAVLLKMDEAQGRVGTPGALVRRGPRDEASVPGPRPRPLVIVPPRPPTTPDDIREVNDSEKLRTALAVSLGPDDDCFDLLDPEAAPTPLEVVRLDARTLLVSHRCWLAAYNAGVGYWVIDDAPPWNPVPVTTMGTDYADGTITASHKGRGLGDCWSVSAWSWNGRAFVPTAESHSGQCKLVAAGGAWSLPTWVADVRPATADASDPAPPDATIR